MHIFYEKKNTLLYGWKYTCLKLTLHESKLNRIDKRTLRLK